MGVYYVFIIQCSEFDSSLGMSSFSGLMPWTSSISDCSECLHCYLAMTVMSKFYQLWSLPSSVPYVIWRPNEKVHGRKGYVHAAGVSSNKFCNMAWFRNAACRYQHSSLLLTATPCAYIGINKVHDPQAIQIMTLMKKWKFQEYKNWTNLHIFTLLMPEIMEHTWHLPHAMQREIPVFFSLQYLSHFCTNFHRLCMHH